MLFRGVIIQALGVILTISIEISCEKYKTSAVYETKWIHEWSDLTLLYNIFLYDVLRYEYRWIIILSINFSLKTTMT